MERTPLPTSKLPPEAYLRSRLLTEAGFRHSFLTRLGGVSKGVFSSLSFALGTGDQEPHVRENLRRVGIEHGIEDDKIFYLSQVHGTSYHIAHSSQSQSEIWKIQGDIVLSQDPTVAAAIRTADCVPVLLGCRASGWVAACHSGWQGCEKGAAIATVNALKEQGARDLIAAIGPHISLPAFEVGDDVARRLLDASPDKTIVDRSFSKPHVNLRLMVRAQLKEAGLADDCIDDVQGCTVLEPKRFFSYRRDKNPSGRLLSLIVPPVAQ